MLQQFATTTTKISVAKISTVETCSSRWIRGPYNKWASLIGFVHTIDLIDLVTISLANALYRFNKDWNQKLCLFLKSLPPIWKFPRKIKRPNFQFPLNFSRGPQLIGPLGWNKFFHFVRTPGSEEKYVTIAFQIPKSFIDVKTTWFVLAVLLGSKTGSLSIKLNQILKVLNDPVDGSTQELRKLVDYFVDEALLQCAVRFDIFRQILR